MSDVVSEEEVNAPETKQILIEINESKVSYTSEMGMPEVVFWLDVVQAMLMTKITSGEDV